MKCKICGEDISDGNTVSYKGGKCHENCFNLSLKIITKSKNDEAKERVTASKKGKGKAKPPPTELQDNLTEEEFNDKKQLYAYIKEIMNIDKLPAKVYVLVDRYMSMYGFTYKGITETLHYYQEVLERKLEGDVIGIVPYYYHEAEQYNKQIVDTQKRNQSILNQLKGQESSMSSTKYIYLPKKMNKVKEIDISQIGI